MSLKTLLVFQIVLDEHIFLRFGSRVGLSDDWRSALFVRLLLDLESVVLCGVFVTSEVCSSSFDGQVAWLDLVVSDLSR